MTQVGDIMADLDAVSDVIARAESELAKGVVFDMSPLESQIESICARIESLPSGEGLPLQPKLLALADAFGRLGQSIEAAMEDVHVEMNEINASQQAAGAYAKPVESS